MELSGSEQVLLALPGDAYSLKLLDACRELDQSFDSVCYVTLTKMLQSIVQVFEQRPDVLFFHHGNVRSRTAERYGSQFKE